MLRMTKKLRTMPTIDDQWLDLEAKAIAEAEVNGTGYSQEISKAIAENPELYDQDVTRNVITKEQLANERQLWHLIHDAGMTAELYDDLFGTNFEDEE